MKKKINLINKILASPLGTFVKGFLSVILAMWVAELADGHDLFTMDLSMIKKLIVAGLIPNISILINWINPQYTSYGSEEKMEKQENSRE